MNYCWSSDLCVEAYRDMDSHPRSGEVGIACTPLTMCVCLASCSVAASGVGFILVIDRRLDRWAAVRATLLRIAVSVLLLLANPNWICSNISIFMHALY